MDALLTGKNVFKKPVKLTLSVVPTQTLHQTTPTSTSPPADMASSSDHAIVFDGKTFTVTFTQTSGECVSVSISLATSPHTCNITIGPTRRFRRVCEKLQTATVNPSSINLLSAEMTDFDQSNPSLSSDDTLAASTASPLQDESNGSQDQENVLDSPLLGGGYVSTDDCESEDGLNTHSLLGDIDH